MYEYTEAQMAKINRYERDLESQQEDQKARRYVNLNQSIFKLQYDDGFMELAYSTARIW